MIAVALDVSNFTRFHMHIDPAAAGTHVTGGAANLVTDRVVWCKTWLGVHGYSLCAHKIRLHGFWRMQNFAGAIGSP
jgi:hypothetical protein